MALPADYISGTITLTNGSPDFTGAGTGWQAADFREGDILLGVEDHAGQVYVIEAITGNAAGTLTQAWAGTSGTYTYRMRYEWDSSRVSAQARAMVELLGNGNLEAEAAIDGTGGNWLSYFTGAGAKARTAFTAKARAILSKENNGDVLAEIGAQPSGDYQPADSDLTAIAALTTTAFGRGLLTLANAAALRTAANAINKAGDTGVGPLIGSTLDFQTIVTGNYDRFGNFRVQSPRSSGTPGNTNYSGGYEAWIGNTSLGFAISAAERVGTESLAILNVRGGGNQAYFEFVQNGALRVPGALSKGSGTFLIDHPLDPLNKDLVHGFVEAPRYLNIYDGLVRLVDGRATVDIDAASNMTQGTFEALNSDVFVKSLQNQEGFARLRPGPIVGGTFEIICEDENCNDLVSWDVRGVRQDAFVKSELDPNTDSDGRFVPERDKPE